MIGEIIALSIMALALGMDAFSMSLGVGMSGMNHRQMARISCTVGIFHVIMPLLGMVFGHFITFYFDTVAIWIGGALLMIIGMQMIMSAFKNDEQTWIKPVRFGVILFALVVSLDSFTAGITLGIFGAKTAVALAAFGLVSLILSWIGLFLGNRLKRFTGTYGEVLGGGILLLFGLKLLWPF